MYKDRTKPSLIYVGFLLVWRAVISLDNKSSKKRSYLLDFL